MPFITMVWFLAKLTIAAIPAAMIVAVIGGLVLGVINGIARV